MFRTWQLPGPRRWVLGLGVGAALFGAGVAVALATSNRATRAEPDVYLSGSGETVRESADDVTARLVEGAVR